MTVRTWISAAAAIAAIGAVPALAVQPAAVPTPLVPAAPSCGSGDLTGSGFTFISCAGYFSGNFISGNAGDQLAVADVLDGLGLPGTSGTWLEKLEGLSPGTTIDFTTALSGLVYLGIHRGGANNGSQGTAFYELNVTDSSAFSLFTFTPGGLSNAALYGSGGGSTGVVPEPETYALMLAGLGVIGFVAKRRRPPGEATA